MAYDLMKKLIAKKKSKETLTKKCNVFYAADQLTDAEYQELMNLINAIDE